MKKRLEEVRLLESRRSARLAESDRDTDFAKLADMANDRRRASHSIDVPLALTQHGYVSLSPFLFLPQRQTLAGTWVIFIKHKRTLPVIGLHFCLRPNFLRAIHCTAQHGAQFRRDRVRFA